MSNQLSKAEEFVERWINKGNEKSDTQLFWIQLCQDVLGMEDALQKLKFEVPVKTASESGHEGYIDAFIPSSKVLIEQKSLDVSLDKTNVRQGRDLTPVQQALAYAQALPLNEQPRFIIASNFEEFRIYDRTIDSLCRKPLHCLTLQEIPNHLPELTRIIKGNSNTSITFSEAVSIRAGEIMGKIHDKVAEQFINPDSEESHHALSVFCTRIMFLMFCEDAGLIGAGVFHDYVAHYEATDLRRALLNLFEWLDTPDEDRTPYANDYLKAFPYMNGGLFREQTEIPTITEDVKYLILVDGCQEFDWSAVDPTVFGSIFEGALSHEQRHSGGMHYTSLKNIHKLIDALFLDDLNQELESILEKPSGSGKTRMLNNFHKKLGSLVFLDPAAGSGNFLTETYKSLRKLENQIFIEKSKDRQNRIEFSEIDGAGDNEVLVSLNNFHGIEINDFACCVARTALWIAEKQADIETEKVIKRGYGALPLKDYSCVIKGNALRMDWNEVVPASKVDYIIGNPPFIGKKFQNSNQKADIELVFNYLKGCKTLDYVSCWFKKACDYIQNTTIKCAFVSTSSICEGEAVSILWKQLFGAGAKISFAWKKFVWTNDAANHAHVHVVIVGFQLQKPEKCFLYDEDSSQEVSQINPYLYDAPIIFIDGLSKPISASCILKTGTRIGCTDYIFNQEEMEDFVKQEPQSKPYFHEYLGGKEFLHNQHRYCLYLANCEPKTLLHMPKSMTLVETVLQARAKSKHKLKDKPAEFVKLSIPKSDYLFIPQLSSESRRYIPIGFVDKNVWTADPHFMLEGATLFDFGILTSQFHNCWMRAVSGKFEKRYRYSNKLVFNTFVWPSINSESKALIEKYAQAVLDARDKYSDCSLSDMYSIDSEWLFPELFSAHKALDKAVEEAYGVDFNGDEEKIVAHLFKLYAKRQNKSK